MINNKIRVGNLPLETTDQDIRNLFSRFGKIYKAFTLPDKKRKFYLIAIVIFENEQ